MMTNNMNWQDYIAQTEARQGKTLPALYKRLAADGMLDWGEINPSWSQTTYPRLLAHPPLLLIGNDIEIPTPETLYNDYGDCDFGYLTLKAEYRHSFIPFATSGSGDIYAFAWLDESAEPCIVLLYHDDDESLRLAANLENFIFAMLLRVEPAYGEDDSSAFRAKLQAQLASHRTYLKPEHHELLADIYRREFRTEHQPRAAHVDDECRILLLQLHEFLLEVCAEHLDACQEFLLGNRIEDDVRSCTGKGVAAKCRAMIPCMERSCDFIRDSKGTDRHTAGKTFRERHNIRFYAVFLIGEERPRAPDSRLNLIEDEERTMLVAEGTNLLQIVVLRRIDAPLPLNRLEHDRCRLIADLRLEICNIIVADIVKACRQRAKSLVILRLPRRGQCRKRTPVKAIPRREYLRFLGMDLAGVLTCNL